MDEARLVEAILAERVSKDLYADLGSRRQVNLSEIKTQQQLITRNYDKLIENISKAANEPVDTDALVEAAVEVENG
jgi:ribosomal protein L20A (L18A)